MGRIFKYLGTDESARALWENREALDKYLARLKELMEADEPQQEATKEDAPSPDEPTSGADALCNSRRFQ